MTNTTDTIAIVDLLIDEARMALQCDSPDVTHALGRLAQATALLDPLLPTQMQKKGY